MEVEKPKLLIIGGTGSLGHCMARKLQDIYRIIILSRDEDKQWKMKKFFPFLVFVLCDIRDKEQFERILLRHRPNKVIIAAALKHIDICEYNIDQCILTNIIGVQNVINSITENSMRNLLPELDTVAFISTDKAASPVNVYGMCKSICERIMAEKSYYLSSPKFVCVRYGNVLYSRGSLFPLYREIGTDPTKEFFPVTDEKMTRFFISLDDSVDLIMKAIQEGKSGDTYIPKIQSYRIADISACFSEKYGKPVKVIGIRPGEKLHECLINSSERHRTIKLENAYVIKPCYGQVEIDRPVDFPHEYTSEQSVCADIETVRKIIL